MSAPVPDTAALDALARDYAALTSGQLRSFGPPGMTAVRIAVRSESIATATQVRARLLERGLFDRVGWLRCESAVGRLPKSAERLVGVPLDGEWTLPGECGVRLLYDGAAWRLIEIVETEGEGEPVLKEELRMAASRLADTARALRYAVYWGGSPDGPSGIRRIACRFIGFIE